MKIIASIGGKNYSSGGGEKEYAREKSKGHNTSTGRVLRGGEGKPKDQRRGKKFHGA